MTCTSTRVSAVTIQFAEIPFEKERRAAHVVESDAFRVRDFSAVEHLGEVFELVQDRVAQLVPCKFVDDPAEVALVDVAVLVAVKVPERLAEALALQALHELRELAAGQECGFVSVRIVSPSTRAVRGAAGCSSGSTESSLEPDDVSAVRLSQIERAPRAVKVERDSVRPAHRLEHLLELVKLDFAIAVLVEDAESDLKAGIPVSVARDSLATSDRLQRTHIELCCRLLQDLLERDKVVKVDATAFSPVGDFEQERVLLAANLGKVTFGSDSRDEIGWRQVAVESRQGTVSNWALLLFQSFARDANFDRAKFRKAYSQTQCKSNEQA